MRKRRFGFILAIAAIILVRLFAAFILFRIVCFRLARMAEDIPAIEKVVYNIEYNYYRHSNSRILWHVELGSLTGFGSGNLNSEEEAAILAEFLDPAYLPKTWAREDNADGSTDYFQRDYAVAHVEYEYTAYQTVETAYGESGDLLFIKTYDANGVRIHESVYWEHGYGLYYAREYDRNGLPLHEVKIGLQTSESTEWTYDDSGRIIHAEYSRHNLEDMQLLYHSTSDYIYDPDGNVVACLDRAVHEGEMINSGGWACEYDENHHRLYMLYFDGSGGLRQFIHYTYDWDANRTTETHIYKSDLDSYLSSRWYLFHRGLWQELLRELG